MKKSTLMLLLLLITWAAMAVAFFWALAPFILTPLSYLFPSDWTDADLVRHLWPCHLVPPEWVSAPPDYGQWVVAETKARLAVVFLGWLVSITFIVRRYIRSHKKPVPDRSPEPADAVHVSAP